MTTTTSKLRSLSNQRWDDDYFHNMRKEVLAYWPTGAEAADLDRNLEYLRSLGDHLIWPKVLASAKAKGQMLLCPQMGFATIEEMTAALKIVAAGGADHVLVQCDPYTRKLRLKEAERAIQRSYETSRSQLSGYPYINFGVERSRTMLEAMGVPLFSNANNDADPRLLAEISYASGATNNLMLDLRDLLTHEKNYPVAQRIINNQYVCRLASWYTERGVPIELTAIGTTMACVGTTPGMAIAVEVLECLTAAGQGVRNFSLWYDAQGSWIQDVAAMEVLSDLVAEYFQDFRFEGAILSSVLYPNSAEWPASAGPATALMSWLTTIAAWGGADWLVTKTAQEGIGIPTPQAQIEMLEICRYVLHIAGSQKPERGPEFELEREMIRAEARAIIDACLDLGDGDPTVGRVRGVETGIIDVPFPSWEGCRREVMVARDAVNAVRWSIPGAVPLPPDVSRYHRERLAINSPLRISDNAVLNMAIDSMRALGRVPGP
jgi:methylaspartate mutase epsilon subunit